MSISIPLLNSTDKMQSSSSVPVLILVLCCMASAHKAIHNRAIHHLERIQRQDNNSCSFSTPERKCEDALNIYHNHECDDFERYPYTQIHSILDAICSDEVCIEYVNNFYYNYSDPKNETDYICLKQNYRYCYAIKLVKENWCQIPNDECGINMCINVSYCEDFFTSDYCCCMVQWAHMGFSYHKTETEACQSQDSYDTCNTCVNVGDNCISTCVGANCPIDPTSTTIYPSPTTRPMVSVSTAATVAVVVAIVAAAIPLIVMAVIVFIRKISRKRLPTTT